MLQYGLVILLVISLRVFSSVVYFVLPSVGTFWGIMGGFRNSSAPIPHDSLHPCHSIWYSRIIQNERIVCWTRPFYYNIGESGRTHLQIYFSTGSINKVLRQAHHSTIAKTSHIFCFNSNNWKGCPSFARKIAQMPKQSCNHYSQMFRVKGWQVYQWWIGWTLVLGGIAWKTEKKCLCNGLPNYRWNFHVEP